MKFFVFLLILEGFGPLKGAHGGARGAQGAHGGPVGGPGGPWGAQGSHFSYFFDVLFAQKLGFQLEEDFGPPRPPFSNPTIGIKSHDGYLIWASDPKRGF